MSNYPHPNPNNLPPSLPAPPRFDAFSDRPPPNSYGNNNNNTINGYGNGPYDRNLPSSLPPPPPPSIRMNNNNHNGPPPPPTPARAGGRASYEPDHQRDRFRRDDRGGAGGRDRGPPQRMGRSPDGRGRRRNADKDVRSVEERVKQERRCRTLFVRNVAYEANAAKLQDAFAQYGEIKTFYEKIKDRGIVFVTYYDLRAPPVARDAMHNTLVEGRPIDVHYSLPKEDDTHGPCDRDKNQGSIMLYVKPPRVLTELEVGQMAEGYGVVKSVKPGREPAEKIIDFFDSRAAVLLHDRMQNKPFAGGTCDLRFIWDELDDLVPPVPPMGSTISHSQPPPPPPPPANNHGRQPRRSGEGPGYGEVRGHAHAHGRDRDRDRSPDRRGSYTGPGGPPNRYGDAPPSAPPDDRLEQARKVQQLLASLGGAPAPPPTNQGYPPSTPNNGYGPPAPGPGPGKRQDYSSGPYQNNQYQPRPAPAPAPAPPPPSGSSQYPSYAPPPTSYAPPPTNYPPYPPSNNHNQNQNQYQPPPPPPAQGQGYPPAPAPAHGRGAGGYAATPASQNGYNPNQPPISTSTSTIGAYQPPQQTYGQQQQQQQQAQDVNSLLAMLSNSAR